MHLEVLRLNKLILNLPSNLRVLSDHTPLLVSPASFFVWVLLIVMHVHGRCLAFHQHGMSFTSMSCQTYELRLHQTFANV